MHGDKDRKKQRKKQQYDGGDERPRQLSYAWQRIGDYEYEYTEDGHTGRCRCVNGRLADGTWPTFRA